MMDALFLSRLQFALTAAFHYIFPPLSIGLGLILVIIESIWLVTRKPVYHQMARFWTRVFALTFSIGVASGLVLEFEFGTNWSHFSRYVGDIFGSALAAEGIFAFFLESGFLAILLFGWDRVGPKVHFLATCMVCLGAHFSAVWIVVANSWQQTPAGFHIVTAGLRQRAEVTDFWAMVFNPSAAERLGHVLCGAWQAGAFLVLSVSAFYILRHRHLAFAEASLKVALFVALIASSLQLVSGHSSAVGVSVNQPAKLAAFEGLYETQARAPMYLFGWVDQHVHEVRFGVALPGLLSWLVHGDVGQPVTGLDAYAPADRPPVNIVFQSYHAMVMIGLGLLGLSLVAVFFLWRGRLLETRWLLWLLVLAVIGPQLGNQVGWLSAEVGRQPWAVYGLLRTADAVSPLLHPVTAMTGLLLFGLIYLLLLVVFVYLLNDKIQHGPDAADLVPRGRLAPDVGGSRGRA